MALLVALSTGVAWTPNATAGTVIAETDNGPVEGLVMPTMHKFLGIPYAAPPVGNLRWQPPQPPASWASPLDATAFANHCPQVVSPFGFPSTTEDCLYLNVYTPNKKGFAVDRRRRRPVIVWIHGGAFSVGESDDYDPIKLIAGGDVIVVTINYRIGALGFLAHPALTAESPTNASGNYGLMDQQYALQWVHRNIAAFGGNPRRVTIAGESAGGISVHAHMASPGAAGLFHRAIVESGAVFNQLTLADAETRGTALATTLGCSDQSAACLRALPIEQILADQGDGLTSAGPIVDGALLPQPIRTAFETGHYNQVPVIEGSNHDEFRLFVALLVEIAQGSPLTAAQYPAAIETTLGVPSIFVPVLMNAYPLSNYASPGLALSAMATDAAFVCNARAAARLLSRKPTFAYEFNDTNAPQLFLPAVSFPYGAAHASELQYLFNVPDVLPVPAPPLDADQQQLSATMIRYWTRFARSGKPHASNVPRWPKYNPNDAVFLSLVAPTPVLEGGGAFTVDHKCGFWDPLLGND
jgi:para-nitrobenzyl esterase